MQKLKYILPIMFASLFALVSCSEDFLDRPPVDSIVDAGFYKTDDQVLAATALLYSKVWFDYNDKASYNLGDFRAGTAFSAWNDRGNVLFNTTGSTPENGSAWRAFYNVVGQSNLAIANIERYAGDEVSPEIKKVGIAEARFMRALAYRFLVMNWGDVPIIENNLEILSDTSLTRNTSESVWKFITSEMRAVAKDLPETPIREGRVTKWSAEGMLARFYLTRAGLGASPNGRDQVMLDSAKYYADRVITQSGHHLLANYEDLFKYPYDNNEESLFSLQWVYAQGAWGAQNSAPAYLAYSSDIANGDGWGGDKGGTWWMLSQYEGFNVDENGVMTGRTIDQRLKATFMLPGFHYPEITQSIDGGEQELVYPFVDNGGNYIAIKKYITGKAKDVGGNAAQQNYGHDTYMQRLAEIYLIYAEAALGNQESTSDAKALEYFNAVHTRAGLPRLEDPLTMDIIFRERICEFAMEGMAWYDMVSMHYYNPNKVYEILNSQDRGIFFIVPDQFPEPTSWEATKTEWFTERTINANSGNFLLPIPAAELSQAPNLSKPAVDYYQQ